MAERLVLEAVLERIAEIEARPEGLSEADSANLAKLRAEARWWGYNG